MSIKRLLAAGFAGFIVFFAGASMASAHVSNQAEDLKAGGYGSVVLRVPHGCEGLPTNVVEVQIPEGFTGIKPQAKAGWTVEAEMVETAPYEMHGQTMTERIGIVRWSGGNLPDSQFEDFAISLKAPETPGVAAFPTIQYCGSDATEAWIEVAAEGQDPHDLDKPAPTVTILEAAAHGEEAAGHGGDAAMDTPMVDAAQVESLQATVTALEGKIAELESAQSAVAAVEETEKESKTSPLSVIALIAAVLALGVGAVSLRKS